MLGGKMAVVFGYGEVGKGCAQALRGQGCRVVITEIDPICALQAVMEGYEVVRIEDVIDKADLFVTATGNLNVLTVDHMARMKDKAIVGNIGHFDNEIDMAGLKKVKGIQRVNIKPQYDEWQFPDGHSVLVLAEGRLLNLGCATGHPSFVMSASFTNQTLAQMELWEHRSDGKYENKVYILPKELDEEVARRLGAVPGVTAHVSLDGARAGLHDSSRGVPGSWRRAIEGIDRLLGAGVGVCVVHVVTPANARGINPAWTGVGSQYWALARAASMVSDSFREAKPLGTAVSSPGVGCCSFLRLLGRRCFFGSASLSSSGWDALACVVLSGWSTNTSPCVSSTVPAERVAAGDALGWGRPGSVCSIGQIPTCTP